MTTDAILNMKRVLSGNAFRGTVTINPVPAGDRGFLRYTNPVGSGKRFAFLEIDAAAQAAVFLYGGVIDTLPAMTPVGAGSATQLSGQTVGDEVCVMENHTQLNATVAPYLPNAYFQQRNVAADVSHVLDWGDYP